MESIKGRFLDPDADILPPSDDRIFKVLLTHNDAERVLIDIISAVIGQKVVKATIRNVELPKSDIEEKGQRFDVNCSIDNGDQVNVEMHSTPIYETGKENMDFKKKCTYFLTDLHSSQKSRGVDYLNIVRTYQ
ncbi:MAG: Rpn family recombination-promoting nuclease/putative transposase, partial [Treponema sp.]|nr:Rpn family recombination-promoting nuclease/putative transposase [Treponema sp.]